MKLAVISHKVCWTQTEKADEILTDGGFPLQIGAISELFGETKLVVPIRRNESTPGLTRITGRKIGLVALTEPFGRGLTRKLAMFPWLLRNGLVIGREVWRADAVHTPIPGDVGTIGLLFALLFRKPLFVRHCGNWMVRSTLAERFWFWLMIRSAGGRNVMLATGGADTPPSSENANVEWIFSTSLTRQQVNGATPRQLPAKGPVRLVIACRQEPKKGTDVVIRALHLLSEGGHDFVLDVIGGGSLLSSFRELAQKLGVDQKVTFHGKTGQSEVLTILGKSHLFCYPTSASEGFPKVVLEALASGLPVITTPVSVLPKLIGAGCGIVIQEGTPELLAEAVKSLCADPGEYNRCAGRAVEVARQFSLEEWREFIAVRLRKAWQVESLDG